MAILPFPVIDLAATGKNIQQLRQAKGYSVRYLQRYFGFQEPQAIYKWQRGECLPSVDNLFALSVLLGVSINEILIPYKNTKPQDSSCGFGRSFAVQSLPYQIKRLQALSSLRFQLQGLLGVPFPQRH